MSRKPQKRFRDSAGHYTFVSSLAVYPDPVSPRADETTSVATLDGPIPEKIDDANEYGALKALCEEAAQRAMPGRVFTVRPGLLIGPHDETDRFAYWPRRIDAGGRLVAAEPAQPVQLIDARDLASWLIDSVERGRTGKYNATGPAQPLTMEGLLEACREVSGSSTEIAWAGDGFLREQGVEPWEELPVWLPAHLAGFLEVDCSKAIEEGLRFRPLRQSIEDVLSWEASRSPQNRRWRLSPARERELLELLA